MMYLRRLQAGRDGRRLGLELCGADREREHSRPGMAERDRPELPNAVRATRRHLNSATGAVDRGAVLVGEDDGEVALKTAGGEDTSLRQGLEPHLIVRRETG